MCEYFGTVDSFMFCINNQSEIIVDVYTLHSNVVIRIKNCKPKPLCPICLTIYGQNARLFQVMPVDMVVSDTLYYVHTDIVS